MIRMKGDIIRQLNLLYPEYSFKNKFRNDFKNRIIFFFDQLLKERTLSESLELSKKYCIIENNEIKLFTNTFLEEHKNDLFNSFNPMWLISKRNYRKKKEIETIEKEEAIEASEELLQLIINDFFINKFNSSKINEQLKEFQRKNDFYGNTLLYQVRNNKMDICLSFKGYTINNYKETQKTFHEIVMSNKEITLNNMNSCLNRLNTYVNYLLINNTMFNLYLKKDSILSLLNVKYEKDSEKKDFCLTFVPEKNKFLLMKNKDLGINCFTLIKEIDEEDIFNHKELKSIKYDIEYMIIMANKYRKLRECVKTLLFDEESKKEREWNKNTITENIDLMFSLHEEK